jgi:hypothetical protein
MEDIRVRRIEKRGRETYMTPVEISIFISILPMAGRTDLEKGEYLISGRKGRRTESSLATISYRSLYPSFRGL